MVKYSKEYVAYHCRKSYFKHRLKRLMYAKKYRLSHRNYYTEYNRKYRSKNREKWKFYRINQIEKNPTVYRLKYILNGIRQRCQNPKNDHFRYYGKKGIRCLLTFDDLINLWNRDIGNKLERPSVALS